MTNQALGMAMMDAARTYPNDHVAVALSRTGDKLTHLGMPYAAKLDKVDHMTIAFFKQNIQK